MSYLSIEGGAPLHGELTDVMQEMLQELKQQNR